MLKISMISASGAVVQFDARTVSFWGNGFWYTDRGHDIHTVTREGSITIEAVDWDDN